MKKSAKRSHKRPAAIFASCLLTFGLTSTVIPTNLPYGSVRPTHVVMAAESVSDLADEIVAAKKQADEQAEKLTNLNKQIEAINNQITDKSKQMALRQQDLENEKSSMGARARVMYMYGNDGYLEYLFSSKNISDFFSNIDQVTNIVRADREKVEKVQSLESQLEDDMDTLKAQQKQLQSEKADAEKTQKAYDAKVAEEQKKLQQYANSSGASSGNSTEVSDQMDFICAVVAAECNRNYEGALAVISCVMNRVDSGKWGGHDAVSVLKAPGQFAAYLDGPYKRYLGGKYPDYVKKAVYDCMIGGIRNHPYQSFRSGSSYGVWNCGGNSYR